MINDLKVTETDLWKYVDNTTLAEALPKVSEVVTSNPQLMKFTISPML